MHLQHRNTIRHIHKHPYIRATARVEFGNHHGGLRDLWRAKWHLDTFLNEYSCFPLSVPFRQCSISNHLSSRS